MSRAERDNNPGNLRPGDRVLWSGQTGVDPDGFAIFKDRDSGLAAAQQQVLHDYNNGLKTPRQLVQKYTKTDQGPYMQRIAGALGIGVDDDAKLADPSRFATYMGALYGNEDAQASGSANPDQDFGSIANLGGDAPDGDFAKVANVAPPDAPQSPAAPDHSAAAVQPDPLDLALQGADQPDGESTLQESTTAGVNAILKNGGGPDEISTYLKSAGVVPSDPNAPQLAFDAYKAKKPYDIRYDIAPPPDKADELGTGLDRGLRDVTGTVGDLAASIDRNIPGASWIDKNVGAATGVQGNALQQAAASHEIADAYDQGPYGNSLVAGAGRLGGNLTLGAPLVMATDGAVGTLAPEALSPGAVEYLAGRGGMNLLTRAGSLAARGATGGAEYGAVTSGANDQSLGHNMLTGAALGAVAAPVVGGLGGGLSRITGTGAVDPATAALANEAVGAGIPIRSSQLSRNGLMRSTDMLLSKVPGSGMAEQNALQRQAFTRAISNTFGEDATALTPEVMSRAKTNIGGRIGAIADRNTITDTSGLVDDLAEIEHNANGVLENSKPVSVQIGNILDKIGPEGTLSGKDYQTLIRKGGPLDAMSNSGDPAKVKIASDIRDALDDAFEQSVSPDDLAAFRQARLQYKNLMTVAPLAAKAGAEGGEVSPALLQNRVTTNFKDRAFSGADQLGTLGDIGQAFLKPAPSSNTAENQTILRLLGNVGKFGAGTGAAVVGLKAGLPPAELAIGGVGSLAAASAASRAATKILSNPARANKLIDAALNDNNGPLDISLLTRGAIPFAGIESNRLRLAAQPK